jgi:NodT family efflux transporter outer membrane factor (OMF) lipoprotein
MNSRPIFPFFVIPAFAGMTGWRTKTAALALPVLALAGCTVGPDFARPEAAKIERYTASGVTLPSAGIADPQQRLDVGQTVAAEWWTLFRSAALDQTLALALAASPTLDTARATLAQAREAVAAAAGAYYPQLDIDAGASRERSVTTRGAAAATIVTNVFSIGPAVSYAPDVFGGIHRFVEQQSALAEVQRCELAAAYLSLTGNAVTQAITIALSREQIVAAREILSADEKNLDLVRISFEAGKAARTDVLSAESQLEGDQTLLPPLRQQLSVARHALAVLAGKAPAEWSPPDFDFANLDLPLDLPVALPSALVRERPDILAAEAELHAASAAIGVATAQLYPNVTLSAAWTQQSASMGTLFDSSNGLWSVVSGATAPLFHGGTLEAERQQAIAAFAAQMGTYRQTVLLALGQVADVLRALQHDAELLAVQRRALDTAQDSLALTQDSYAAGQASLLQVLDAQRLYAQARLGYAKAKGQRYLDTAQLFEAMGGAWRDWKDPAMTVGAAAP